MNGRRVLTALLLAAACWATPLRGADFDPLNAEIEENLRHPAVPAKAADAVASAMGQLIRTLRNAGYTASGVRSGQVALVTIPAADLFAPGLTTLRDEASAKLRPLLPYIQRSDNYKVILAVHSDDTGDALYNDRLTADRANAIDEYFYRLNGNSDTGIIPYGLGLDEPVAPNNTIEGRSRNRRIEIYFVPTEEYISKVRRR